MKTGMVEEVQGRGWSSPSLGTVLAFLAFAQTLVNVFLPREARDVLDRLSRRLWVFFSSYVYFRVNEYDGANLNELYTAVQTHLSESAAMRARSVNLALPKNASALTYSLAENERMEDTFQGVTVWWDSQSTEMKQAGLPWDPRPDEKRCLRLRIHKKHRETVLPAYVQHILDRASAIKVKQRDRLLYTNLRNDESYRSHKAWQSVPFKHPATFDTLALHPSLKQKIIDDLSDFAHGEAFYQRVGRAWKRGYLLYGPPGTGKSSMIAAMANFLQYDVYDLELTEVKSNASLRNLLIKTSNKSIIVIEDIDCSLDLEKRKKPSSKAADHVQPDQAKKEAADKDESSKVTLSGLLNFTDGLWSCCGSERIFVFTTNNVEKLDPALLRSGRMDMHIHLSYCCFEAFKVMARNYLGVEGHPLFGEVEAAMAEEGAGMTPADVCEVLTREKRDVEAALRSLVVQLRESKKKKKEEGEHEGEEEAKKEAMAAELTAEKNEDKSACDDRAPAEQ